MRQVTCTSKAGAPLITASDRDGGSLLFNSDLNNTVWLGKDPSITAGYDKAIPLSPQSWLALDGLDDIYGVCSSGQTVIVNIIDGGLTFFQSGITSGAFRIGPQGLFIYGTSNPAFGTPPLFSATPPSSTHDPFGNPVVADAVSTYNAFGAALNVLSMAKGGFFQYQDLGSAAQGIMILSILSVAGVDPVNGSTTRVGQFGQNPFGEAINVIGDSISLFNALIAQATGGRIKVQSGSGASNPYLQVDAPEQGVAGHMQMLLQGTSPDGTQPGQLLVGQVNGAGGVLTPTSQSMMEIQSNISGASPDLQLATIAAADPYLGMRLLTDANNRLRADGGGPSNRIALKFGPGGATSQDARFYNSAAAEFAIDPLKANVAGSAEVWHLFSTLGYQNGWLDGTDALPSYKFVASPDNAVTMGGSLTAPVGVATGQTIVTLGVAYRPNNLQMIAARNKNGQKAGFLSVGPGGVIAFQFAAGTVAGDIIQFQGTYYLDR